MCKIHIRATIVWQSRWTKEPLLSRDVTAIVAKLDGKEEDSPGLPWHSAMANVWSICVLALCCVEAGSESALSKFQKSMTSLASSLTTFERKGLEILGMEETDDARQGKAVHKRSDSSVRRIRIKVIHHDEEEDSDRSNGSKMAAPTRAPATVSTFSTEAALAGCARAADKTSVRACAKMPATTEPSPTGGREAGRISDGETPNAGRLYKLGSRDHLRIHIIQRPYDEEANETKRSNGTQGTDGRNGSDLNRRALLRKHSFGRDTIPAEYIEDFESKVRRVNESLQRVRSFNRENQMPRFRKRRDRSGANPTMKPAEYKPASTWYKTGILSAAIEGGRVYYALSGTAAVAVIVAVAIVWKRATKRDPVDPEELLPLNTVSAW